MSLKRQHLVRGSTYLQQYVTKASDIWSGVLHTSSSTPLWASTFGQGFYIPPAVRHYGRRHLVRGSTYLQQNATMGVDIWSGVLHTCSRTPLWASTFGQGFYIPAAERHYGRRHLVRGSTYLQQNATMGVDIWSGVLHTCSRTPLWASTFGHGFLTLPRSPRISGTIL